MLSFILGLIPGALTTINGITNAIANEKIAVINATTDKERIAAQERVNTLQAQRDVLIADANRSSLDIWMRSLIALGPASVLFKILFWDKTLGSIYGCAQSNEEFCRHWFTTDALDPYLWGVVGAVAGFYFLGTIKR